MCLAAVTPAFLGKPRLWFARASILLSRRSAPPTGGGGTARMPGARMRARRVFSSSVPTLTSYQQPLLQYTSQITSARPLLREKLAGSLPDL
jgi:hypothetical protein